MRTSCKVNHCMPFPSIRWWDIGYSCSSVLAIQTIDDCNGVLPTVHMGRLLLTAKCFSRFMWHQGRRGRGSASARCFTASQILPVITAGDCGGSHNKTLVRKTCIIFRILRSDRRKRGVTGSNCCRSASYPQYIDVPPSMPI